MTATVRSIAVAALTFLGLILAGLTAGGTSAEPVSAPMTCEAAPEYMPANACNGPLETRDDLQWLNRCDAGPVQVDVGGVIVGDANRNGYLDGVDCSTRTGSALRDEPVDCSPAAVAAAFADLYRGSYDGLLSTCVGVDEDAQIVNMILTSVGK